MFKKKLLTGCTELIYQSEADTKFMHHFLTEEHEGH